VEGYTLGADRSGVFGHSDVGWGVYGISRDKPGVVGETSNPDLSGVYGYSAVGAGVRGRSEGAAGVVGWTGSTSASGVLGHSQVAAGVRGMSDGFHAVMGVTSSSNAAHAGVYARNDGDGPAAWIEGDLYVTGALVGNLGATGGGPFPRPAFDSGWIALAKGETRILPHPLGGNIDNFFGQMNVRCTNTGEISNFEDGGDLDWRGHWWSYTAADVRMHRGSSDDFSCVGAPEEFRLRIWVYR
jgi:hypothetical protein